MTLLRASAACATPSGLAHGNSTASSATAASMAGSAPSAAAMRMREARPTDTIRAMPARATWSARTKPAPRVPGASPTWTEPAANDVQARPRSRPRVDRASARGGQASATAAAVMGGRLLREHRKTTGTGVDRTKRPRPRSVRPVSSVLPVPSGPGRVAGSQVASPRGFEPRLPP
ncbi:MAG: hypothetical protein ACK559_34165 [bacterium]